jgi:ankyrin repeat protein
MGNIFTNKKITLFSCIYNNDFLSFKNMVDQDQENSTLISVLNLKENGHSLLHYACYYNRYKFVKILIEKGADLNSQNNEGNTCLHICSMNYSKFFSNKKEILLILLLLIKNETICPKIVNNNGDTYLHILSYFCSFDFDVKLINKDIINIKNNKGFTALLLAISIHNSNLVKKLIECGADVNICDNKNNSPLSFSINNMTKRDISIEVIKIHEIILEEKYKK